MGKRFKNLEAALRYVKNAAGTGEPNVPANTPLDEYYKYKKEEKVLQYTRRDESKPGELLNVAVRPFAFDPDDEEIYIVDFSKRVSDETRVSALVTASNLTTTIPDEATIVRGFVPAKCTVSFPNDTLDRDDVPSQITGIPYNKVGKESYTFPYGSNAGGAREQLIRSDIRRALPATANGILQFKSEKV